MVCISTLPYLRIDWIDDKEIRVSRTKVLQYISIYVYMIRMCRKEKVGEGEKGKGDKLKGTS